MAITSLDGVLAGAQPCWPFFKTVPATTLRTPMSLWGYGGLPGAGTYNTTINGGTYSSSSGVLAGQIPHFDPAGGLNSYLARLAIVPITTNGLLLLCDRLWDNQINVTITTSQAITSPTWPARDLNGATAGAGVLIGAEASAATASTTTLTLGFTNSAGTTGHTAVFGSGSWNATVQGGCAIFGVTGGDYGVQSVQSIQLTASMVSGTVNLFAFRVIAGIDCNVANGRAIDSIKGCFQRIYNGTVPFFLYTAASATGLTLSGTYQEAQG